MTTRESDVIIRLIRGLDVRLARAARRFAPLVLASSVALASADAQESRPLPAALVTSAGARVTTPAIWRATRRPELLRLFEQEIYGRSRVGKPAQLRFVLREEKRDARGGRATRLRVGVLFEGVETGRQMELLVYLPNQVRGRVPLFLGLNFDGNYSTTPEPDLPLPAHFASGLFKNKVWEHRPAETGRGIHAYMWPYDTILARGYGIATAAYGEIEPDMPGGHWRDGPRGLGPPPGATDWGAIGAWAWGMRRAMDYLETNPRVDAKRVALFGFSRIGKAAMWAGAQDERFAMVISQESGKGGVSLSTHAGGEPIAHLVNDLGHWFAPSFAKYAGRESALPVDGHELAALVAPRPLLVLSGTTDAYSDPEGEFLSALAADPVYRMLGTDGLAATTWPPPGKLIASTIGYYLRAGGHDVTLEDWQATLLFADQHLSRRRD
ncbi:MAG: acetylxylan esterase [Gemmatimonadetes bacterium]|nr:acetylxylan esterase [Gemmatimonadota bacterium]